MASIFRKGQSWSEMHGCYDHLILFSALNFWSRSILNDRKAFNSPEEFQPERYLKDGKLNPDVRDPECAAFGFGRRSVNTTYSSTYIHIYSLIFFPVYVQEDILATTRYTQLHPVFSRYMTSNHQLMTREMPSSSNLSLPPAFWRKYVQLNIQVSDSWKRFDSTVTPFLSSVLSNLERLRLKHWFAILSMKKVNLLEYYRVPLSYCVLSKNSVVQVFLLYQCAL